MLRCYVYIITFVLRTTCYHIFTVKHAWLSNVKIWNKKSYLNLASNVNLQKNCFYSQLYKIREFQKCVD